MTLQINNSPRERVAGRLGRAAARIPVSLKWLDQYATLPEAPALWSPSEYRTYSWGMLGNDRYGDCTFAGLAHLLEAVGLLAGDPVTQPSDQEVIDAYLTFTHGQDAGAVEADVLATAFNPGLIGHTIKGYAPGTRSVAQGEQIVSTFGGSYLGVTLTQSDMDQFQAGEPWSLTDDQTVIGGHCVPWLEYDRAGRMAKVLTWKEEQLVTYEWLAARMDEQWAVVPDDATPGLGGLDETALEADLKAVSGSAVIS